MNFLVQMAIGNSRPNFTKSVMECLVERERIISNKDARMLCHRVIWPWAWYLWPSKTVHDVL